MLLMMQMRTSYGKSFVSDDEEGKESKIAAMKDIIKNRLKICNLINCSKQCFLCENCVYSSFSIIETIKDTSTVSESTLDGDSKM